MAGSTGASAEFFTIITGQFGRTRIPYVDYISLREEARTQAAEGDPRRFLRTERASIDRGSSLWKLGHGLPLLEEDA